MAEHQLLSCKINLGVRAAISRAISRHRILGESIAKERDGKVVILTADQIPQLSKSDEIA